MERTTQAQGAAIALKRVELGAADWEVIISRDEPDDTRIYVAFHGPGGEFEEIVLEADGTPAD